MSHLIIKTLRTHNPDSIELHLIVKKLKFICPPNSTPGVGVIRKHSFSRPDLQEKKKNTDCSKLNEYRVKQSTLPNVIMATEVPGTGPFRLGMCRTPNIQNKCQEESNIIGGKTNFTKFGKSF